MRAPPVDAEKNDLPLKKNLFLRLRNDLLSRQVRHLIIIIICRADPDVNYGF